MQKAEVYAKSNLFRNFTRRLETSRREVELKSQYKNNSIRVESFVGGCIIKGEVVSV